MSQGMSLPVVLGVVLATLTAAAVLGWLLTRHHGAVRPSSVDDAVPTPPPGLDLPAGQPTVVHFTAKWCGPCANLRRVLDDVCADLPAVARREIDMDVDPELARTMAVLSLPTTFIYDAQGRERYRSTGVPKAADLRSALLPLLA